MNKQVKTLNQMTDSRLLYDKNPPAFGYMIITIIFILMAAIIVWSRQAPKIYMITANGIIESENKNYVMSSYSGQVAEVYMEEGSMVIKGAPLLKIKSTDINLQVLQLEEQKELFVKRVEQYRKLVESIQDDINYFDAGNTEDSLYYSQFEAYKSQIRQNTVDISQYKAFGYSDEQIQEEMNKNQAKITELYYSSIQAAESSVLELEMQIASIDAQMTALNEGQGEYTVTANASGIIHLITECKEGMVVQAASSLASISTMQDEYMITAYVSPQDMPRISVGNKVDIAVAGLAQTLYGTISGEVVSIDSDITFAQGTANQDSTQYFKVRIKPDYTYLISKDGNKANITSGMAVEARIQYDKMTYFDYVMEALGVLTR